MAENDKIDTKLNEINCTYQLSLILIYPVGIHIYVVDKNGTCRYNLVY